VVVAPPFASLFFPAADVYDRDERDDGEAWTDSVEWGAYEDEPVRRGCLVSTFYLLIFIRIFASFFMDLLVFSWVDVLRYDRDYFEWGAYEDEPVVGVCVVSSLLYGLNGLFVSCF